MELVFVVFIIAAVVFAVASFPQVAVPLNLVAVGLMVAAIAFALWVNETAKVL